MDWIQTNCIPVFVGEPVQVIDLLDPYVEVAARFLSPAAEERLERIVATLLTACPDAVPLTSSWPSPGWGPSTLLWRRAGGSFNAWNPTSLMRSPAASSWSSPSPASFLSRKKMCFDFWGEEAELVFYQLFLKPTFVLQLLLFLQKTKGKLFCVFIDPAGICRKCSQTLIP